MFLARWMVDIKFGHKDEFMAALEKWQQNVGEQAGFDKSRIRWLTGSIGAPESRFEMELTVENLDALEKAWAELPKIPAHQELGKAMSPLIVAGSNRWEVFRILDK